MCSSIGLETFYHFLVFPTFSGKFHSVLLSLCSRFLLVCCSTSFTEPHVGHCRTSWRTLSPPPAIQDRFMLCIWYSEARNRSSVSAGSMYFLDTEVSHKRLCKSFDFTWSFNYLNQKTVIFIIDPEISGIGKPVYTPCYVE